MSNPEISAGLKLELKPLTWRLRMVLRGLRFLDRMGEKKARADSLHQAGQYEKKAAGLTNASPIQASKLRVSAGRAYINARKPESAITPLEEARPHIEDYMKSGVLDGFICLAGLYHSLEHAYKKTGDKEKAEEIHGKALDLAASRETHFGAKTYTIPVRDVLITSNSN